MSEFNKSRLHRLKKAAIPDDPALRILSLATLINTFGNGLFMTIEVIYFTFHVGLSPTQVALGLSIAGGVSMLFSVPAGHLADRVGPRDIAVIAYVGEGLLLIGFIFVQSFWPFLLVAVITGAINAVGQTLRMATIASFGEGEERIRIRAFTRSISNLGLAIGTVFAGIALAIGTDTAYTTMLILDSASFMVTAFVWRKLPFVAPTLSKGEPFSFVALKDKRYVGATLLNGVMSLHFVIQNIAIPLWIVKETNAPRWWVALVLIVNMVAVILFQVRASRGTPDAKAGAKKFEHAGFYVAIACLLYGLSSGVSTLVACTLLVVAMIVHVIGELLGSVGAWSIGFGLADPKFQGQYQGVFSLGWGIGGTFGPSLVVALTLGMGLSGWIILAVMFSITGILMRRLVNTGAL